MKLLLTLFLAVTTSICSAQNKFTISGYLSDKTSGEKLIGASIFNPKSLKGTSTNVYGFYSLTLPSDTFTLVYSFVGYTPIKVKIDLKVDQRLDFELSPSIELNTFEVSATKGERIEQRTQMSSVELSMKQVEVLPALLGERDILKILQLMPGIQSGGEGSSGLYVRGGGPDQNLILLDGVPVYNASHLFGFFSVFNSDAIKNVELTKGGFPARYSGRLSSVLDIRMKEGNLKEWHGSASIGLIASKLTVEGPLWKDRTSIIVSGRRTYIDVLAAPFIKMANQNNSGPTFRGGYYFYDLNAKINHKINDKNRIFLSTYLGKDLAYADFGDEYIYEQTKEESYNEARLGWGNKTTALRWNWLISNKLFANTTLTYSKYNFNISELFESTIENVDSTTTNSSKFGYDSGIDDFAGKIDIDYIPNPNHYIKFGISDIYHTFTPGINAFQLTDENAPTIDTTFGANQVFAHEFAAYIENDMRIGARLKMNVGINYSGLIGQRKNYFNLQPRIAGRFLLSDDLSIKASYTQMAQYIHLLTNASIGLPTDLWVPSTDSVSPENSEQFALGIAKTFKKKYEVSIEAYYKTMQNLIEYKEGASFFSVDKNWDQQIEIGNGNAYGFEFFIQKKEGKTTGWIGYTLSWTNRTFDNLNFGEPYPYRYDRRHDLSIVLTHKVSDNFDFGATWVYGTGNAVTLSTVSYIATPYSNYGNPEYLPKVSYFNNRNDFRMPSYHRLDFGANFHKEKKYGKRTFSVGAYNAYSRRNPFFIYFEQTSQETKLKQISLFPIIPFVAYNYKF
jgi:outer membrane cobalamin receptor